MQARFLSLLFQIWEFLLDIFSKVFVLYTTQPVLMAAFTLWILDRVFGIFDLIKG